MTGGELLRVFLNRLKSLKLNVVSRRTLSSDHQTLVKPGGWSVNEGKWHVGLPSDCE